MKLFDLHGKTAVVTGASRGLGKAMAIGLAEAGANIVAASRNTTELKKTVSEIKHKKREAILVKTDVSKKTDVENMVKKAVDKFRKIDILVNNAGILKMSPSEKLSEKDFMKIIDVNLKGEFLCAQTVGKQMIKQKSGSIINIASIAGEFGFPLLSAYNASKGGIITLTKVLAVEWAKYNIRVNAIAPGVFKTNMTAGLLGNKEFTNMIKIRVPLARSGKPDELKGTAIFLSSDASSYITGHVLVVDGGWTAGL